MPKPNARRVPFSSLTYNPAAARYIGANGRFLSTEAVRTVIDADIEAVGPRMAALGEPLKVAAQKRKDGAISQAAYVREVKKWRDGMAAEVKATHLGQGAAGVGGFHNMDAKSYGAVGGRLKGQFAYLSNFASECAANPDIVLSLDPSRRPFDERVQAYPESSRATFNILEFSANVDAGFLSVENEEDDGAHHCTGDDSCPAMTKLGRVSIGDKRYKLAGFRRCKFKCRCRDKYSKAKAPEVGA